MKILLTQLRKEQVRNLAIESLDERSEQKYQCVYFETDNVNEIYSTIPIKSQRGFLRLILQNV